MGCERASFRRPLSIPLWPARRHDEGPIRGPRHEELHMSQYLILIYDDEAAWQSGGEQVGGRIMAGHEKFGQNNAAAIAGGNALQPTTTATSIRPDGTDGFTVTDGPFVETKEALGGYYVVEASDLDEAIALAKQIPVVSGGLEVRPIMVFS
jgi:hypothetical protein